MPTGKYLSEADFACGFLRSEFQRYVTSKALDAELHLEETVGNGRADLTVRVGGQKLLVVEAKLETDPWHPEVVREGLGYALTGFPFFATCNPSVMVLFKREPDPFSSALGVLYYDQAWVDRLLGMTAKPPVPRPLYGMLLDEGVIDGETAKLYEDLQGLDHPEEKIPYERPKFRLVATGGPYGEIPRTLGTASTLEEALEMKAIFESNGLTVKVQDRVNDRWRDFDPTQGKL